MTTEQRIQELIDKAIRQHEWRVALISGLAGGILLGGIGHAFLLLKHAIDG